MKIEYRNVYIADDGSMHETEEAAVEHEKMLARRQREFGFLQVHVVNYAFDATEGKGYFARRVIITDEDLPVVLDYCFCEFGRPLRPWYGDGYYRAWDIAINSPGRTPEWAMNQVGTVPWHGHRPIEVVVLSENDFTWAGLPKSVRHTLKKKASD